MIKHLGVTGSRRGLSLEQLNAVSKILKHWEAGQTRWFHHGDCVGVDISTAALANAEGYQIVIHPPRLNKYRAWGNGDIIYEPKDYMERNEDIILAIDYLLVIPEKSEHDDPRSGTWATKRMAEELNVPFEVIMP